MQNGKYHIYTIKKKIGTIVLCEYTHIDVLADIHIRIYLQSGTEENQT